MKKILFFAAIAAVTLSSCSNEAGVTPATPTSTKAVAFRTVVDKTKATPIDDNNFLSATINAGFVNSTTYDFMQDVTIANRYGTGNWVYNPIKYWPSTLGGGVAFFAYSPVASANVGALTLAASGNTSFIYTAPVTAAKTEDLVVAHNNIATIGAPVGLHFTHVLSKIAFSAQNESEVSNVVITKIRLVNFSNKETFTSVVGAAGDPIVSDYSWSTALAANQTKTFAASVPTDGFLVEPKPLAGVSTKKNLTTDNEYLMIIPQTGVVETALGAIDGSYVEIEYYIRYEKDGSYYIGTKDLPEIKKFNLTGQVFALGSAYNLNFKFPALQTSQEIQFTVTHLEWGTETEVGLN